MPRRCKADTVSAYPRDSAPRSDSRPAKPSGSNGAGVSSTGAGSAQNTEPAVTPGSWFCLEVGRDDGSGVGRVDGPDGPGEDVPCPEPVAPGSMPRRCVSVPCASPFSRSADRKNGEFEERFIPQDFQLPLTFRGQNRPLSAPEITGPLPSFCGSEGPVYRCRAHRTATQQRRSLLSCWPSPATRGPAPGYRPCS